MDLPHILRERIARLAEVARRYQPVIHATEFGEIRSRLISFRGDHLRQVTELSATLPEEDDALADTAFADQGTAFLSEEPVSDVDLGRELQTLRELESDLLTESKPLLEMDLPEAVRGVVAEHAEDVRRHLRYLDSQLEEKIWESRRAS